VYALQRVRLVTDALSRYTKIKVVVVLRARLKLTVSLEMVRVLAIVIVKGDGVNAHQLVRLPASAN
jgi:hypothetical protein